MNEDPSPSPITTDNDEPENTKNCDEDNTNSTNNETSNTSNDITSNPFTENEPTPPIEDSFAKMSNEDSSSPFEEMVVEVLELNDEEMDSISYKRHRSEKINITSNPFSSTPKIERNEIPYHLALAQSRSITPQMAIIDECPITRENTKILDDFLMVVNEYYEEKESQAEFEYYSIQGSDFIKHMYGSSGHHPKRIYFDKENGCLKWDSGSFNIKGGIQIKIGKCTEVFNRSGCQHIPDNVCFSIVNPLRTLDLQAKTPHERDIWAKGLSKLNKSLFIKMNPHVLLNKFLHIAVTGIKVYKHMYNKNGVSVKTLKYDVENMKIILGKTIIPLSEVLGVVSGKVTDVFRRSLYDDILNECCFSIIHLTRTIDLQTISPSDTSIWVFGLNTLLEHLQRSHRDRPLEVLFLDMSQQGCTFILHDENSIFEVSSSFSSFTGLLSFGSFDISLREIQKVKAGKNTPLLLKISDDLVDPQLCFSIYSDRYVLNIQAISHFQQEVWVKGLQYFLSIFQDEHKRKADVRRKCSIHLRKSMTSNLNISQADNNLSTNEFNDQYLDQASIYIPLLSCGATFIKYTQRHLTYHEKFSYVDMNKGLFIWGKKQIPLTSILAVVSGKVTPLFKKEIFLSLNSDLCFSLLCVNRTLDFSTSKVEERDFWVMGLRCALTEYHKSHPLTNTHGRFRSVGEKNFTISNRRFTVN